MAMAAAATMTTLTLSPAKSPQFPSPISSPRIQNSRAFQTSLREFRFVHLPGSLTVCRRQWQHSRCSGSSEDSPSSSLGTPPTIPPRESSNPEEPSGEKNVENIGEEIQKEVSKLEQRPRARREADSSDWISSSLTRRFGLAGGLAWVGFLAFGVISEQIKTRTEVFLEEQATQDLENAEEVILDNDVKYVDMRQGGGSSPLKGDLVLLDVKGSVSSTGQVFIDTLSAKRPLAFVYGLKPYARGICYGLEYAMQSMKAGGKRKVTVPAGQCFGDAGSDLGDGVLVPGGANVEYEVELQRVSIAPS